MTKQKIAFDFMAKGYSHSLYHIGLQANGDVDLLFLHDSNKYQECVEHYCSGYTGPSNVISLSQVALLTRFLGHALFSRNSITICGAHLWQLILLSPIFLLSNITVHLHGQAYSLKNKNSFKFYVWNFLSIICSLKVANPNWSGPEFVTSIDNLMIIPERYLEKQSKNKKDSIILYSATNKQSNVKDSKMSKITDRFELVRSTSSNEGMLSHEALNQQLSLSTHALILGEDDYYFYSPSGKISDLANYNLVAVIFCESQHLIPLFISNGVEYEVLS